MISPCCAIHFIVQIFKCPNIQMSLELKVQLEMLSHLKIGVFLWYSSNSSWVMDGYGFYWSWGFQNGAEHFYAFSSSRVKNKSVSSLNSYINCHLIFCSQLWNWEDQQAIRCNSERGFVVFNDVFDDSWSEMIFRWSSLTDLQMIFFRWTF